MEQLITIENKETRPITVYSDFILMPGMNEIPSKYLNDDKKLGEMRQLIDVYIKAKVVKINKTKKEDNSKTGIRSLAVQDAIDLVSECYDILKMEEWQGVDERVGVQKAIRDQLKKIEDENTPEDKDNK